MKYELKPLGTGSILDQSIRILKDHFGLFFLIMLCLQIPVEIFKTLLSFALVPDLSVDAPPDQLLRAGMTEQAIEFSFALVMFFTVTPITNAAIVQATANIYLGKPTSVKDAFRVGLRRFLPLVATWIQMSFIILLGTLLCILPGIFLAFRYVLAENVAVLEGISGSAALKRSKFLMLSDRTKHYNTAVILGVILFVVEFGIFRGAQYIPERHVANLLSVFLQAVCGAFGLITFVVFYFSCRCRAENFDLLQLAEAVETLSEKPLPDAI